MIYIPQSAIGIYPQYKKKEYIRTPTIVAVPITSLSVHLQPSETYVRDRYTFNEIRQRTGTSKRERMYVFRSPYMRAMTTVDVAIACQLGSEDGVC